MRLLFFYSSSDGAIVCDGVAVLGAPNWTPPMCSNATCTEERKMPTYQSIDGNIGEHGMCVGCARLTATHSAGVTSIKTDAIMTDEANNKR